MKLLRRRKTILVILVAIWLGGMIYFLAPLTGSKDDSTRSETIDSLRFDDDDFQERRFEQNSDNRDTYDDNVRLKNVLYYKLMSFNCNIL